MNDDLWYIAIHEAGHAVAGFALGLGVKVVTIEPDSDAGNGGHWERLRAIPPWISTEWSTQEELEREIGPRHVATLAGGVASELAGLEVWGCESDDDGFMSEAGAWDYEFAPDGVVVDDGKYRQRAKDLLEEHWSAVLALANALMQGKTLHEAEAVRILVEGGVEAARIPLHLDEYEPGPFPEAHRQWVGQLESFAASLRDQRDLAEVERSIQRSRAALHAMAS